MHQLRTLTALAGSTVRTEGGQLIADAVLLVGDTVITPVTGRGVGEFVPAGVLADNPSIWDGTLVTAGHPHATVSIATDTEAAERLAFGQVRNARFRDGKLVAELALDPARAQAVGHEALSVVARLREGRMVEVSIGAWVTMTQQAGTADGRRFEWVWEGVRPDHVAALGADQLGACNGTMGCGIGRPVAAQGAQAAPTAEDVLEAIHRARYERESRRIRLAALAAPPPEPYTEALKKRQQNRR